MSSQDPQEHGHHESDNPQRSDARGNPYPSFNPRQRRIRPASARSDHSQESHEESAKKEPTVYPRPRTNPQRPHMPPPTSSTSEDHQTPIIPPSQPNHAQQVPHEPPSYQPRSYRPRAIEGTRAIPQNQQQHTAHQPRITTQRPHSMASSGFLSEHHPPTSQINPASSFNSSSSPAQPERNNPKRPRKKPRFSLMFLRIIAILLVAIVAWVGFLLWDSNRSLAHVDALDLTARKSDGDTYLIAGSDSRSDGTIKDDTQGARADSIILVNTAPNGQSSMISLPRDTYVEIPEYGWNKLNAAYSYGGARLLVTTVEKLTGLTVDHFISVEMGGLERIIDAIGGVKLCLDMDVSDHYSELEWKSGCHIADGKTGLAFSRMRYADPNGDIGRGDRQRQVVSSILTQAVKPSVFLNPVKTLNVERAVSGALTLDRSSNVFDVGRLALAMRNSGSHGLVGAPPIAVLGLNTDNGSAVELVDNTAPDFFGKVYNGTLTPKDFQQGM